MGNSLFLGDIGALQRLQNALGSFSRVTEEGLQAAESEIRRTLEWLRERVIYWQKQVEKAQHQVAQAEMALRQCQASGYWDQQGRYYAPNCRPHQQSLRVARDSLQMCQESLQKAQMWRGQVEQAVGEYQKQARRLHELTSSHTDRTRGRLRDVAAKYWAVQASENAVGSGGTTEGWASNEASIWVMPRSGKRIQLISVAALPEPEGMEAERFKKVSEAEMRAGLRRWLKMRPRIEGGTGNSSDYWAEVDRQEGLVLVEGLVASEGYQRVYEAFYGDGCIKVAKVGSSYEIINGEHRVWLAKQMGIMELPVLVINEE